MPRITFIQADGQEITVEAKPNYSLMEIALENNIKGIDGVCGGSLACATCHCYIHPDWQTRIEAEDNEKTDEEIDMLEVAFDERPSSRLGCQIKVTDKMDGLIVGLPMSKVDF